jgi:hypothetical protein
MVKNMRSVILRAIPNGWSYKLVAVVWQTGGAAALNLLEKTWQEGLIRDNWTNPTGLAGFTKVVATTHHACYGPRRAGANTLAPACWVSSDFDNASYQSQKLAVATTDTTTTPPTTETVTKPVKLVKTQFILYFWNPVRGRRQRRRGSMSVDARGLQAPAQAEVCGPLRD